MKAGVAHVLAWDDIVSGRNYTMSVKCISPIASVIKIEST